MYNIAHKIFLRYRKSTFLYQKSFSSKPVNRDKCDLTRFQLYIRAKTSDNNFLKLLDIFARTHSEGLQRVAKVKSDVTRNRSSRYFSLSCFTVTYNIPKIETLQPAKIFLSKVSQVNKENIKLLS